MSQRLHSLEEALREEHAEHEATKAELRRTMREVECLRHLIEGSPVQPPRVSSAGGASNSTSIASRESLYLRH
jgi:hypothetical protein